MLHEAIPRLFYWLNPFSFLLIILYSKLGILKFYHILSLMSIFFIINVLVKNLFGLSHLMVSLKILNNKK